MTAPVVQVSGLIRSLNPADPDDLVLAVPGMDARGVAELAARLRARSPSEDRGERAARLDDLAAALRSTSGELSSLLSREIAKLPTEAEAEVEFAASIASHY